MRYVSLLLHIYQPPTQDISMVRRIDRECYTPLTGLLVETGAEIALNINYSLTEKLAEMESPSIENLRRARGVEFTDSGAYHPIFPLIGKEEILRQLRLNREGNRALLGDRYRPTGVFPPEMAYSRDLPAVLAQAGYSWTVTDDIPWSAEGGEVPFDRVLGSKGISVLLRSNFWSNRISFHGQRGDETALELLSGLESWAGDEDAYVLIAMDGETYGHHRRGMIENFLAPFIHQLKSSPDAQLVPPGRLTELFPPQEAAVPDGSWSTTAADCAAGKPWPLWYDRDNPVHISLWELLRKVLGLARGCESERVAKLADMMLYSCPFWWASEGRFDAVQVRRGILAVLRTAIAACEEMNDCHAMDDIMESACSIPVITGKDS